MNTAYTAFLRGYLYWLLFSHSSGLFKDSSLKTVLFIELYTMVLQFVCRGRDMLVI